MLHNVKVDVIYYSTNTDFEMEFNLCGCCRMRLLTDKAADCKQLVQSLSRAVSRSKVIICCGPLFEESGLINSIATAISKKTCIIDNAAFGIKDSAEISVIDGALPLVTSEGLFGGCIIESGPQTIIILSENKSLRKSLMTSLVHPYIEDLSKSTVKNEVFNDSDILNNEEQETETQEEEVVLSEEAEEMVEQPAEEIQEEITNETEEEELPQDETEVEESVEEPQETSEEVVEDISAEDNEETVEETIEEKVEEKVEEKQPSVPIGDFIFAGDEQTEEEVKPLEIGKDDQIDFYIEPKRTKYSKDSYYAVDYVPDKEDEQFYIESGTINYNSAFKLPVLILTVILLVALAILAYILLFVPLRDGYNFSEYMKEIFALVEFGPKLF